MFEKKERRCRQRLHLLEQQQRSDHPGFLKGLKERLFAAPEAVEAPIKASGPWIGWVDPGVQF